MKKKIKPKIKEVAGSLFFMSKKIPENKMKEVNKEIAQIG